MGWCKFGGDVVKFEGEDKEQRHSADVPHHDAFCNFCSETIYGTRYRCNQCADFDSCHLCLSQTGEHGYNHLMLPIIDPDVEAPPNHAPLFSTFRDLELASSHHPLHSSPEEVLRATTVGDDFAKTIDISWWPKDGPRFIDEHGEVLQNVAPTAQPAEDEEPGSQEMDAERPPRQIVFCQPGEERSDLSADQITCVMSPSSFYETMISMFAAMKQTGAVPIHMCPRMYEYTPLNPGRNIRIITLWPGSGDTQLRCETREVALGEGVYYEALSYTWGDQSTGTLISFNGLLLPIAPNLCSALLHLRLPDRPRMLWIDAICINQLDNEEKSGQVRMMREIYEEAAKVVVWLGPTEDDSDAAMDLIAGDVTAGCEEAAVPGDFEYIPDDHSSCPESKGKNPDYEIFGEPQQIVRATMPSEAGEYSDEEHTPRGNTEGSESPGERAWTALHALVQRPWWSRVWVLQEYTVPKQEPTFQCGTQVVTAKELQQICSIPPRAVEMVANLPTPAYVAVRARFRLGPLFMTREKFQAEGHLDLRRLLRYNLNTQATNLRDKVFALLGLTPQECRNALVPDYSKSITQIYTETARYIIQSTGDLNILAINTNSPRAADPPLPSWVPDWALLATRAHTLQQSFVYQASGPYAACIGPSSYDHDHDHDPSILEAGGIPVDRITHVTDTIPPQAVHNGTAALRRTVRALHDTLLAIMTARIHDDDDDGGGRTPQDPDRDRLRRTLRLDPDPRNSDQFWRTLVADRHQPPGGDGDDGAFDSPAPDAFAELFELFLYGETSPSPSSPSGDDAATTTTTTTTTSPPPLPRRPLASAPSDTVAAAAVAWPRLRTPRPSAVPDAFLPSPSAPAAPAARRQRLDRYVAPLAAQIAHVLAARRVFVTEGGRLGVGPAGCAAGDVVAVLMGGEMPFLLREEKEEGNGDGGKGKAKVEGEGERKGLVRLVGEAYVHGVMHGEVVEGLPGPGEGLEGCMVIFRIC